MASGTQVSHSQPVEVRNGHSITEVNIQLAVDATGFGKFNYMLILICGLICLNVQMGITNNGFILTAASCDFHMNTIDKGRLVTGIILGMLCGGYIWGCLADIMGRRFSLLRCLFIQSTVECIASFTANYWGMVILKSILGFSLGGQIATVYTYLGEFQPTLHRKRALSCMEIPIVMGIILSPLMAWLIIPIEINIRYEGFFFHSWNLFMAVSSIPSWIIAIWLIFLPETPKYLSEFGKEEKMMFVLTAIYQRNTGNPAEQYLTELNNCGISSMSELINKTAKVTDENRLIKFFKMFFHQTVVLLKPPHFFRTLLVCALMFCAFSSLYTLNLWFPELFDRFAVFELSNPGKEVNVCSLSVNANNTNRSTSDNVLNECVSKVDTKVYIEMLTLGVASIPVGILFPIIINRVGFKICLIIGMVICACATAGLLFARSSLESVILSAVFQSFISICATVLCCVVVEIFPTNLRATASALASLSARAGALTGNMTFSYLIDNYCKILIIFLTVELLVGGILAIFLPNKQAKPSNIKVATINGQT